MLGAIRTTREEDYQRYGYASGKEIDSGVIAVDQFLEKPGVGVTDSPFAVVAGYVFSPDIFPAMEKAMKNLEEKNTPDELYWADGMNIMLSEGKQTFAVEIQNGRYYDCGNKLEYLKAVVEFGLKHEDLHDDFSNFLKNLKH
ncbi:MAG TPA: sugar phosphate nucleotidyltransferase [Candidatus Doudnabacteria bacterium]|nr:sugar phosphate nucleotidyltransferase [Candidatus Doudnabacteria bacterium]